MNSDWQLKTYSLAYLRTRQSIGSFQSVFNWLKYIGVIPKAIESPRITPVRLALDANKIDAKYLASAAYEWDSWGRSKPRDFLDALDLETAGSMRKDVIVETLTALGRVTPEEPVSTQHRLLYEGVWLRS